MANLDSDLKQQLQELQQQQQQKLLERRKKKEEANNKKKAKSKEEAEFGIGDDLDLKLASHPSQGFGYVSEELVDHLNDQIRQMKDENGRLYKLLNEKDFEMRQVKKKAEQNNKNSPAESAITNETAATRIVELSSKVRQLTAEKEAEKTKCKQFQKKCHDLQMQLQSGPSLSEQSSMMGSMISLNSAVEKEKEDSGVDVKALQAKLKQAESRCTDYRNTTQQLRNEIKVAHKVLSQEIGENTDINIQSLLNSTTNWRGRAQQIISLQQKVAELQVQLEATDGGSVTGEKGGTARKRKENKHREEMMRMERERREAQENTTSRLKSLEQEHESLKDKLEAAKARNKVLVNEIKGQKSQVQTLLKKSRNDDEFIDALMKQQTQLKTMLEQNNSQQAVQQMQAQQQMHQMSMKAQQDGNITEQLKAIAAQKEAQVKMLEMELQQMRLAASQNQNGGVMTYIPQTASPSPTTPIVTATIDSRPCTAESDVDTLTDRSRVLSQSARSVSRASRASSRGGNHQGTVTDAQLIEMQHTCREQEIMRRAVEVERDKMTELVGVLQHRLGEETQKLTETQTELQGLKRAAVELEKRLGRVTLDGQKKGATKGRSTGIKDGGADESDGEGEGEINELMTKLEIQQDENQSLKQALQRTLKAKNDDLKVYGSTLEETKKVFLEALRQMKSQS